MSFTTQNGVMQLIEDMIISAWPESLNHIKPKSPFPRIPYSDAMRLYGIDKPDMRIPWQIDDVDNDIFEFLQKDIDDDTWRSRILVCRGAGKTTISNSMKNEWKRLIQMNENGKNFAICHPSQKRWFKPFDNQKLIDQFGLIDEDVLIVCWGNSEGVYWTLGKI